MFKPGPVEEYPIDQIYSWWTGINVTEDDDYYILDLTKAWLTNKRIQLRNGLKGNVVRFYCINHMKYEELEVYNVEIEGDWEKLLILKSGPDWAIDTKDNVHVVDLAKLIKISKFHINKDKFNL